MGMQGPNGTKGEKGFPGDMGIKGLKGGMGEKGDNGTQGQKGDMGPKGMIGPSGDIGDTGKEGCRGCSLVRNCLHGIDLPLKLGSEYVTLPCRTVPCCHEPSQSHLTLFGYFTLPDDVALCCMVKTECLVAASFTHTVKPSTRDPPR